MTKRKKEPTSFHKGKVKPTPKKEKRELKF